MSSEPSECPDPAATSERMMPWRTSFACASSSVRRSGARDPIPAHISVSAPDSSKGHPCLLGAVSDGAAGEPPDPGVHPDDDEHERDAADPQRGELEARPDEVERCVLVGRADDA